MQMDEQLTYWMALAHIEQVTTRRKNEILVVCFNKKQTPADFFAASEQAWQEVYKVTAEELPFIREAKEKLPNYAFQLEDLLEQGFELIPVMSPEYPEILKANLKYNSPVLLYIKGNKALLHEQSVAVVGSRHAGEVALRFTDAMAARAAGERKVVVSGYAKGVDRQALDSVLANGGSSIVVLPQGIETFGTGFRQLYKSLTSGRLVVMSIFAPKAPWSVGFAMARNPIIYGMAGEIYVAESDAKGGTFAGVNDGLRRGRTIYVRMPAEGERNANLQLIDMGATPVDNTGNVVEYTSLTDTRRKQLEQLLTQGSFTAKELAVHLLQKDDPKSQAEIRRLLKSVKGVVKVGKSSPVRYRLPGAEENLFDLSDASRSH